MLRWIVIVLFLVNLLVLIGGFGPRSAAGKREPHHLNQQIHPERLTVQPIAPSRVSTQ